MNGIVPKGPHVNKQGVKLQQKLESLYGGQCQHLQSLRITDALGSCRIFSMRGFVKIF